MAIMVFKRTVYETRRRPKGLLRPKTRANLKDAQNVSIYIVITIKSDVFRSFNSLSTCSRDKNS